MALPCLPWVCLRFVIVASFGSKFYRQIVDIPMGTNCAPLVVDMFCFVMRGIPCCLSLTIPKQVLF